MTPEPKRPRLRIPMENTHHSMITDGVPESEQNLGAGRPFWVFIGGNTSIATWMMGILVADMNLNLKNALFVILSGSLIGSVLPAMMSVLGPRTRLSQIEASRFALGKSGKTIPALLNWISAIGWDVINNVISASAMVVLFSRSDIALPVWLSLLLLVSIQLFVAIYGHHLIQSTAKFTGTLLGFFFLVIGLMSVDQVGFARHVPEPGATIKDLLSAFALLVACNIGWSTCAADYTRYLPGNTPAVRIFMPVFLSLFISLAVLSCFGYLTAAMVTDQSPIGVMESLAAMSGQFAPIVLLVIWFSAIPANAINDNTAAYTLLSVGFRLSRPVCAIIGSLIGFCISLFASLAFVEFFEEFLLMFAHWVTPWAAVILVHWYVVGKKKQRTPEGFTGGFVILMLVSVASVVAFTVNPLYTGPVAGWLGDIDIGPYCGFVLAGLLYYGLIRLTHKDQPKHNRHR